MDTLKSAHESQLHTVKSKLKAFSSLHEQKKREDDGKCAQVKFIAAIVTMFLQRKIIIRFDIYLYENIYASANSSFQS